MLDTFSGRLWQIAESGEIGVYLRSVPYRTTEGGYSPLPEDVAGSKPGTSPGRWSNHKASPCSRAWPLPKG